MVEVWLPIRDDRIATLNNFIKLSELQGIKVTDGKCHLQTHRYSRKSYQKADAAINDDNQLYC